MTENNTPDLSVLLQRLSVLESAVSSSAPSPGAYTYAPPVALPEKFDGDPSKFGSFLTAVDNFLVANKNVYTNDEVKVRIVGSLLLDNALQWFITMVQTESVALKSFDVFMSQFRSMFSNPQAKRQSHTALRKLRQGKDSALRYATLFRQIAKSTGYNDAALMEFYQDGLRYDIQDYMLYFLEEPGSLEELISLSIRIDNRLLGRRSDNSDRQPQFKRFIPRKPHFDGPKSTPAPGSPQTPQLPTPAPMDLDGMKVKPGKLTPEERNRRLTNNLCLYCGEPGHRLNECSKRSSEPKGGKSLNNIQLPSRDCLTVPVTLKFAGLDLSFKSIVL